MEASPLLQDGMLEVGNGHSIYWRSHGNPHAPAVVILHGGPGGAMNPQWGEFFDPALWHVIFFDQRGCGKSTPFGELRHNDLPLLVHDMERLRTLLGIERWALFGGSWGTTLALAYGAAFPERCLGFLLRGIFLARQEDMDWFLWDVRRIFPDQHTTFLDAIETAAGRRPCSVQEILSYAQAPLARFDTAGITLAHAWSDYEKSLSGLTLATGPTDRPTNGPVLASAVAASASSASTVSVAAAASATSAAEKPAAHDRPAENSASPAVSMALLERHYMADNLPPPPLLAQVSRFAHLPCYIVHGRVDMVCPADQAHALAQVWPKAHLTLVDGAGHWTFAPGISAALRRDAQLLGQDLAGC
jgi:proline iminopeptidase